MKSGGASRTSSSSGRAGRPHRAFIGLGSNLNDPKRQVRAALRMLRHHPAIRVIRASRLYRAAPVGYDKQPWFVNAVAALETTLSPVDLMNALHRIESALGKSVPFPNGPRTIDLDILLFDDRRLTAPGLSVPHPRFRERRFVLVPFSEVAPGAVDPVSGKTVAELLRACGDRSAVEAV